MIVLFVLLPGCKSQELARLPIQAAGEYLGSFEYDGKPVEMWTDLDIEYIESTNVWYEIQFTLDGEIVHSVECDALTPQYRLMAREAVVRGVTKLSYLAPLKCDLILPEGLVGISASFHAEGGAVEIFRGDLIINYKD